MAHPVDHPSGSLLSAAFVPAAALIGAVTLALSSWWLAADLSRAKPARSAEIGVIRGELWLRKGQLEQQSPNEEVESTEAAFRSSLKLAPMNSSAWFGLAAANQRLDWLNQASSRALKMSYYTGFNERHLIAPRLALLAQIDTTRDPELGDLLRRQIRLILTRAPELISAVAPAYRSASEVNRHIIEAQFQEFQQPLPE